MKNQFYINHASYLKYTIFWKSNRYLHCIRPYCKNIFKIVFKRKVENSSTYCSSFQLMIVYNVSEVKSAFPAPLWDYVKNYWYFRGFLWICSIKGHAYMFLLIWMLVKAMHRKHFVKVMHGKHLRLCRRRCGDSAKDRYFLRFKEDSKKIFVNAS